MKKLGLLIIILMLTCGFVSIFDAVQAQSTPAIPEFTVKLVDHSYYVSSTQTAPDPYTGKTQTIPSYRVENMEIEITIKNQKGQSNIWYNIRVKGHFEQEWYELFHTYSLCPELTNSQYTVITLGSARHTRSPWVGRSESDPYSAYFNMPDDGKVDFQVQALSGAILEQPSNDPFTPMSANGRVVWVFDGVSSDWSKTQTLTITKNSDGVSNQFPDDFDTEYSTNQWTGSVILFSVIISIVVVIAVIATVFVLRKRLVLTTV